jgi:hypothetical protein
MNIKNIALCAIGVALVGISSLSIAGQRLVYPVSINDTYSFAVGTVSDARGSADNAQYIHCYNNAGAGWSGPSGGCTAANAAGVTRTCYTSSPVLVDAIRSISSETYIYFTWAADGSCSYLFIENGSRWKPASQTGY